MSVEIEHPGKFIKAEVIPRNVCEEGCRDVDVGRPALSNLLNGKTPLSPEMALRLEKAFGVKRERSSKNRGPMTSGKIAIAKRKSRSRPTRQLHGHHGDPDRGMGRQEAGAPSSRRCCESW